MAQEMPSIVTYVGADGRRIRMQAKDDDGVAYDLSEWRDNGTLTISLRLGNEWKISSGAVTAEAGTDGWHYYDPAASEIDEMGKYIGQVRLVDYGGAVDYLEPHELDVQTPEHNPAS